MMMILYIISTVGIGILYSIVVFGAESDLVLWEGNVLRSVVLSARPAVDFPVAEHYCR